MRLSVNKYFLLFVLICVTALLTAGCQVGYKTFSTDNGTIPQPMVNFEKLKVSISFIQVVKRTELWLALHRTLRGRYHIIDIQPTAIPNDPERFVIEVWLSLPETTAAGQAGENLSYFGVIPVTWPEKYSLTFKVIAPGGEQKIFSYSYTERSYSWGLIFFFFGPGFWEDADFRLVDIYQEDRIAVFDEITARFMSDAASFISSHRRPAAP
jgi:hypothetical protein